MMPTEARSSTLGAIVRVKLGTLLAMTAPWACLGASLAVGLACVKSGGAREEAKETPRAMYERAQRMLDESPGRMEVADEVERLAKKALERDPKAALAHVVLARVAVRRGYIVGKRYTPEAFVKAHGHVDRALGLEADLFEAHRQKLDVYRLQGDFENGRRTLAALEKLRPDHPDVVLSRALLAEEEGKDEEAIQYAEAALKLTEDRMTRVYATALFRRVNEKRGDPAGAEAAFKRELDLDPHSAWLKSNYARFLRNQKRCDEAIVWAERAIEQMTFGVGQRELSHAYYCKGEELRWKQKKLDESEPYYRRSLEADPTNPFAHGGMGLYFWDVAVFRKQPERLQDAARAFERMLELDPASEWGQKKLKALREQIAQQR